MAAQPPPGRREADKLLVLLLRQNGCPVPEGVSSVGQLSSDAVIQAVGSMIAGISGSRPPPPPVGLSIRGAHPAERYHACRLVASRVRDVGYAEPFSAHQLLYPGGEDTRALLLELLSMLPPEGAPPLRSGSASPTEATPLPAQEQEQRQQQAEDLLSDEVVPADAEVGATPLPGREQGQQQEQHQHQQHQEQAEDLLSGEVVLAGTETVVPGSMGDGDGGDENDPLLSPTGGGGGGGGRGGEGGLVDGADANSDDASGGGEGGEKGSGEEGKHGAGSGVSSPEDVGGNSAEDKVDEEEQVAEAEKEHEAAGDRGAAPARGPEEETPSATGAAAAGELPGSAVHGGDPDGIGEADEEQEEEESAAQEIDHGGVAVAADDTTSRESVDESVDEDGPLSRPLHSSAGHDGEPDESGDEESEEEDNVFGPGPAVEVLVDEPAVAEEGFGEGNEEESTGQEHSGLAAADDTTSPESVDEGVDDGGPLPGRVDSSFGHDGEPDEAGVEESEEEDNVFGPRPSVEVLVGEPTVVAEGFGGGEEEEDNVFGLTEPSEAVLGAKAAAREAFQDAPEERREEEEHNVFGPTEPSEATLAPGPPAAELSKDEEEILAVTRQGAEEGSASGIGEPFPAGQAAAAVAIEDCAESLASVSDAATLVGGRDAALVGEAGASDAENGGSGSGGGPSLEARARAVDSAADGTAKGSSEEEAAGAAGATRERTDQDGDSERASEGRVYGSSRAPGSASAGGGAGMGVLLPDDGGKGGGRQDTLGEGRAVDTEDSPEGNAERLEGGAGSGEEGGEGGHEDAEPDDGEEDVVFLQFEVEAKELELGRLLADEENDTKAADEMEEEVRRLGCLAEKSEKHCRYTAKALELLPNVTTETRKMQLQCDAAEARIQAARKAFEKTRKPLEAVVRVQREELARRKARCRALVDKMRGIYAECQEMAQEESSLKAAAREMEAWERMGRGDIVMGRRKDEGSSSSGEEWGDGEDDDPESFRRRRAGALLRMDIDKRITSLCEDAAAQKQEIAISLSEVLDARRDANGAWELLGRSEALPEETLFAVAKQAKSEGGGKANKERTKDLVDAYKRLQVLGDVFSKLVEAVPEVAKREEECRLVEDETEKMLSRRGGIDHLQLLSRDLKRVKEDAFVLEQRLDQALEEDRLNREALQEEQEQEHADRTLQEEPGHDHQEQERRGGEEPPASTSQGEEYGARSAGDSGGGGDDGRAWDGNDVVSQAPQRGEDGHGVPFVDQQHEYATEEAVPQGVAQDEESVVGDERVGVSGASHEYGGGGDVPGGSVGAASEDQEVDFVGEDEEDNVWQ